MNSLKKANELLRNGEYQQSLKIYDEISLSHPELRNVIQPNIDFINRRMFSRTQALPENKSPPKGEFHTPPADCLDLIADINSRLAAEKQLLLHNETRIEILNSGLWDEDWYRTHYSQHLHDASCIISGFDALDHYIKYGWKLGLSPSKTFKINSNPFPKNLDCNHISYFLRVLRFRGYHFFWPDNQPSKTQVKNYIDQKESGRKARGVVYACIVGGYNKITSHSWINDEWDYVLYTDRVQREKYYGIWEIRQVHTTFDSATKTNRWHKMHPHMLFNDYDQSIYIDGNLSIRDNHVFQLIEERNQALLLPSHFARKCTYEEAESIIKSGRFSESLKKAALKQVEFLEKEGFPHSYGLSENNLIFRKHHDEFIISIMSLWWWVFNNHSERDQLALAYSLWKYGFDIKEHLFANCRVNYKHFWISAHEDPNYRLDTTKFRKISPIFSGSRNAIVFSTNDTFVPYLNIAIESLIKHRNPREKYDIIVLHNSLSTANEEKIASQSDSENGVSVRLYGMRDFLCTIDLNMFHVDGYVPVETYNKCFLNELMQGYKRCLYLDSDILIKDDVNELLNLNMNGHAIAASVNVANINAAHLNKVVKGVKFRDYLKTKLGVLDYNKYIQCGVVLLDLEKTNELGLFRKAIDAITEIKKPIFYDQCVFNKIFYNNIEYFSLRWNHVWYLQNYTYLKNSVKNDVYFDYAKARINPAIIHYASGDKYYNKPEWKLADKFWDFVDQSKFRTDVFKDCERRLSPEGHKHLLNVIRSYQTPRPRVLVHLHLFYHEQTDYMLEKLESIQDVDFDLYVTQGERNKTAEAKIKSNHPRARIYTILNAGYDIYPFLIVLKNIKISEYDYVLKIHTKNAREKGKDMVYGVQVPGFKWRDRLINSLLRTPQTFKQNIALLEKDYNLGAIGASEFIFSSRANNEEQNYNLPYWRARFGLKHVTDYIGGSMFLARAYPFYRFNNHGLTESDFGVGTAMATKDCRNLAHVFERLLGFVVQCEGMKIHGVAED